MPENHFFRHDSAPKPKSLQEGLKAFNEKGYSELKTIEAALKDESLEGQQEIVQSMKRLSQVMMDNSVFYNVDSYNPNSPFCVFSSPYQATDTITSVVTRLNVLTNDFSPQALLARPLSKDPRRRLYFEQTVSSLVQRWPAFLNEVHQLLGMPTEVGGVSLLEPAFNQETTVSPPLKEAVVVAPSTQETQRTKVGAREKQPPSLDPRKKMDF